MEDKNILLLDFDGVIADNNDMAIKIIRDCLQAIYGHYDLDSKVLDDLSQDLYYFNTGDNAASIKNRIPQTTDQEIIDAEKLFRGQDLAGMYEKTEMVQGMKELIETCNQKGIKIYISSLAHKPFIQGFLERNNLRQYFTDLFGKEDGKKVGHIQKIRQDYPEAKIHFVSDGIADAKEKADYFYAYVHDNNPRRKQAFADLGCQIYGNIKEIQDKLIVAFLEQ